MTSFFYQGKGGGQKEHQCLWVDVSGDHQLVWVDFAWAEIQVCGTWRWADANLSRPNTFHLILFLVRGEVFVIEVGILTCWIFLEPGKGCANCKSTILHRLPSTAEALKTMNSLFLTPIINIQNAHFPIYILNAKCSARRAFGILLLSFLVFRKETVPVFSPSHLWNTAFQLLPI